MSVVFFKFKSAKTYDTATFDGTGISVFDLKKQIMIIKKLGQGLDFDLKIEHAQSHEVYDNDATIIPRNTQVLVTRTPPAGRVGSANKYLTGQLHINAYLPGAKPKSISLNNTTQQQYRPTTSAPIPTSAGPNSLYDYKELNAESPVQAPSGAEDENMTEEERIQAMFQQSEAYWQSQEKVMRNQRPIRGKFGVRPARPQGYSTDAPMKTKPKVMRPPPESYVCFRCGDKGHWISQCPTHDNPDFDNKPQFKRTTGIPKMFLQKVEHQRGANLMLTQTGDIVVAKPDERAFAKLVTGTSRGNDAADIPDHLKCNLCSKLLADAVYTSCCRTNYCDECIRSYLVENESSQFTCPNCQEKQYPDNLVSNKEVRDQITRFVRSSASNSEQVAEETKEETASTPGSSIPTVGPTNGQNKPYTIVQNGDRPASAGTKSYSEENDAGGTRKPYHVRSPNMRPGRPFENRPPSRLQGRPTFNMRPRWIPPPMRGMPPPQMPGMRPDQFNPMMMGMPPMGFGMPGMLPPPHMLIRPGMNRPALPPNGNQRKRHREGSPANAKRFKK